MRVLKKISRKKHVNRKKIPASDAMKPFLSALDKRLNHRREQWDREDDELQGIIRASAGMGNPWPILHQHGYFRSAGEMCSTTPRRISASFDVSKTTDDNIRHWMNADGLSADAAASHAVRAILRKRAIYEEKNNCYCKGVGLSIAYDFVGTGPRLHIDDDRFTADEREEIERKIAAWLREIRIAQKLFTMRCARRVGGEALGIKFINENLKRPLKLDLKLIEADQLKDPHPFGNNPADGINLDEYGNPVSYCIFRTHPGEMGFGFSEEYDVFPAEKVIHWFRVDRPGQHRGIPEITPALARYSVMRRLMQAVLDSAETAADFCVLLKTQSGAQLVDASGKAIDGSEVVNAFSTLDLQRRMMMALPSGYEAEQMKPEQPSQEFRSLIELVAGEIGRCENVPKNIVLGDFSNSNYSSGTLENKLYFRTREIEREEASILVLENLLSDAIEQGTRIREGDGDRGRPFLPIKLRSIGLDIGHTWYWDSNELGDPLKLASAKAMELKYGLTTIPAEYEKKNKDWVKAFQAQARALGITFEQVQEYVKDSIYSGGAALEAVEKNNEKPKPEPSTKRPSKSASNQVKNDYPKHPERGLH